MPLNIMYLKTKDILKIKSNVYRASNLDGYTKVSYTKFNTRERWIFLVLRHCLLLIFLRFKVLTPKRLRPFVVNR